MNFDDRPWTTEEMKSLARSQIQVCGRKYIESKDDDEDGTRAELPPAFETFMVTD